MATIQVGDKIPQGSLKIATSEGRYESARRRFTRAR